MFRVAVSQSYEGPGFGVESEAGRYSMETGRQWTAGRRYGEPMALDGIEEDSSKMRKRPRVTQPRRRPERSEPPMITSTAPKKGITIGDERAVWHFYHELLKECQQNACKLIAKAWIKAVEPKKQSTHPYTGKDEKAPDWWPKPWGQTKEERVRHKEPDHLLRPGMFWQLRWSCAEVANKISCRTAQFARSHSPVDRGTK